MLEVADFSNPVLGDFDGDGNLDILVSGRGGAVDYPGDGSGGFQLPAGTALALTGGKAADFNGDGLSDVVAFDFANPVGVDVELNSTPGFSLQVSLPGPSIHAGGSATYTVNLGQENGFSGAVTLACSAPESVGIYCSLSPSSLTPGSDSTLTVATTGPSSALLSGSGLPDTAVLWVFGVPLAAIVFTGGGFTSRRSTRKTFALTVFGCILGVGLVFQIACGGGSDATSRNSGTPAGNYTITVTGTSGSLQRTTRVALTVQ